MKIEIDQVPTRLQRLSQLNLSIYAKSDYRNDIQGVRAIGAILIMVYHIWFDRVSGGVDVFFVISGYFMAGMLIRSYLKNGKLNPLEFWGRIVRRVAPMAYVVITATLILGYFFLPPHIWRGQINEALASALHFENWQLIRVGTDYLLAGQSPSPFQQFWALSIQVQFYLLLPVVFYVGIALSKSTGSNRALPCFVLAIILASFGFSVYYTDLNPSAAYFNTGTRAWEFLIGVLAFLLYPMVRTSEAASRALGWVAILTILSVGMLVPQHINYPGYVAIIPVASAATIAVAGSDRFSFTHKILASKPLVYVGGISFSLYLWHWPILVFFQSHAGAVRGELSLLEGLMVIAIAFGLSIASKNLIEAPASNLRKGQLRWSYLIGLMFFIPAFSLSYLVRSELVTIYEAARHTDYVNGKYYEGESAYVQPGRAELSTRRMIGINYDLTPSSLHGCSAGVVDGEVNICEFGDVTKSDTVLLVGGSRLAQWEPFFTFLGKKHGFKVLTATINACSFGDSPSEVMSAACKEWNDQIMDRISSLEPRPKVVVVNTSRQNEQGEFTPDGYIAYIKQVIELGIPVVGLRINPRYSDPNFCLWREDDASLCATARAESLSDENPVLGRVHDLAGIHSVDFTPVLCRNDGCPAYFDGYPVMRDSLHLTKSYVTYLSKALEASLNSQIGGLTQFLERRPENPIKSAHGR